MNIQEALNVFGLTGEVNQAELKKAFKRLAVKYHPDKNPIGAEMMKMVNAAYEFLVNNLEKIKQFQSMNEDDIYNYGEEIESVLKTLVTMEGVIFEVIGNWVWIRGETRNHKDMLKALKCKWAPTKKEWYYRPEEHKSIYNRKTHTIEEIREMYGTSGQRKARGKKQLEKTN
ncbi:DnaJ domain-containing protein [Serratia sp. JKS296]|uniref:J domain-containing protein n=1 Tax=Serratia sp. JKS296 TaxID=1938824 RepID=UPI000BD8140B|nr:DnaJ domain-containing protein [Serratia sp. JKS296]EBR7327618.1 molecular chaperone DnaJ [Salmonella enterica]MBH2581081.1 DnaJ domain-containing protein [Serratia marcescens]SOD79926.1 DnaJ domain-containing protein [Serratia sp. JKS296]